MSKRTDPGAGAALRRRLANELAACGDLREAAWRDAVEAVPREAFLGGRVYRPVRSGPTWWQPVTPEQVGQDYWLDLACQDVTWVTQLDGTDAPGSPRGIPTSSSTMPGLVVRMLEDLGVRDGDRVLEIGTGTGYSTALLAHRLGGDLVTSVEVDPGVAGRAAAALLATGYAPHLVTGDGLAGYQDRAPYERIIATCSVRHIPRAWLAQAAPGARIVATLSGWMNGSGLTALAVLGDGTAHGRFLPGMVSFMSARAHAAPPFDGTLPKRDGDGRAARYGADILDDWTAAFLAQLAAPEVTSCQVSLDGTHFDTLLTEDATGSYAWLSDGDDGWTVIQQGPTRIWDQVEGTLATWDDAGRPAQEQLTIEITEDAQAVVLDSAGIRRSWPLPAARG
ncbi:MAG: ATP-grasp peptide maturase system methyltransferase [Trebonia sp.]